MRYLQALCATILFTHTQAAGMIVESPSLLGQMLKQYQQYVEMLEKAHEQINKLNEINAMMGKANDILNKQSLTIANPLEVIENLNKTLESTFEKSGDFKGNAHFLSSRDFRKEVVAIYTICASGF